MTDQLADESAHEFRQDHVAAEWEMLGQELAKLPEHLRGRCGGCGNDCPMPMIAACHTIERLWAALATARNQALEEAIVAVLGGRDRYFPNWAEAAIRKLMHKEPPQ